MMIRRAPRACDDNVVSSFEAFLEEHLNSLARYARVLTGDRETAHDVLADCLIKAQNSWPKIERVDKPVAYIRRILVNTVISDKRRWAHRNIHLTYSGVLPEIRSDDRSEVVDRLDELHQLLQTLTYRQRTMVVMRYYLDLSDAGIADELGCSESTVRSTISRALTALRGNPRTVAIVHARFGALADLIRA